MGEEQRSIYKVKSRNEMKTINVVFVSDELVGETIVTRKEYDRALRLKIKTEAEKLKAEEAEVITPNKAKKRKASQEKEESVSAKKSKIDDVELALAALVQEEVGKEDVGKGEVGKEDIGKEEVGKEDVGKEEVGKEDAGKKDAGKKDAGKKDAGKKDAGKKDAGKKDAGKKDAGKKDAGKKDTGKKDTEKKDTGKKDGEKKDTGKKDGEKKDTGKKDGEKKDNGTKDGEKKDTGKKDGEKKDNGTKDADKKDTGKKDGEKKDNGTKDAEKKDTGKKDAEKKDTGKKDAGKKDSSKRDSSKRDSSKRHSNKRDSTRRDPGKKDSGNKDSGEKDSGKENARKEDVVKEGVGDVSAEQLQKIMGDEKSVSASADPRFEILTLESYIKGEGSSETDNPNAKTGQGKGAKEKVITPYRMRKRVIKDIKKIQRILENSDEEDNDSSSSESELLESSEESESEENEESTEKEPPTCSSSCINYFEAQSSKRNITSNNSLKILKNPTLNHKELNKIVRKFKISPGHRNAIKSLINESIMLFSKWDFLLKNNFNILLYGLGSKREILNNFVERFAKKYPLIVVNGFFPDLSIRDITEKICQVLEIGSAKTDITGEINRKLNEYHVEIYIVVNNIDGLMLRNKKTQTILSQYAKMEGIHMLATIDHINAPLMWDKSTYSDFNWLWYDATTFLNYTDEVVYEGNIMLQNSGQLTLSSLRNVYNALTKNSRSIFLLMVKREMDSPLGITRGVSFKELYQACRKELLISSDVALRTLLKEFVDHGILKQKKSPDGEEVFVITVENNILKQFVEDQERR